MKILRFLYISSSVVIAALLFFYLLKNPYQTRSYQKQNVFAQKASQTELVQTKDSNTPTKSENIFINFWNRFNSSDK